MQTLLRWAAHAGALYATVWILHLVGLADFGKGPWYGWFLAVVIMALVNALIRPAARFLAAPLNCLTFGIVGLIINALMFALVPALAGALGMPVFSVTPLGAVAGSILVGLLGGAVNQFISSKDED